MNLTTSDFVFVRRIGKFSKDNNARPILISLTQFRTKLLILKNSKLKGSKIVIAEDFPKEVADVRKSPKLVEARKKGK